MTYQYSDYQKLLFNSNLNGSGTTDTGAASSIPGIALASQGNRSIVTYSILNDQSDMLGIGYYTPTDEEYTEFATSYSNIIQSRMLEIFGASDNTSNQMLFGDVANITFQNTDANSNGTWDSGEDVGIITVSQITDDATFLTNPDTPATMKQYDNGHSGDEHGDIFINSEAAAWSNSAMSQIQQGDETYKALLEEVLHSLGVDALDNNAPTNITNQKYTLTAYDTDRAPGMDHVLTEFDVSPYTLQLLDVAALQDIYGRNYDKLDSNTQFTVSVMNYSSDLDDAFHRLTTSKETSFLPCTPST